MNEIAEYINTELRKYALYLSFNNSVRADDLVQETALRCLKYFSTRAPFEFEHQKNIATLTMLRESAQMYKKKKHVLVSDISEWIIPEPAHEITECSLIMDFIKHSSKVYMETSLLFINGYKVSSIAKATNKPVGTVLWQINSAKERLRRRYNKSNVA